MKRLSKLILGSFIALSLLNPMPTLARRPAVEQKTSWYIDNRFDKLYNYIEENKTDPVKMIKEAFKDHNIVCVGEVHDSSHREFAVEHLKELSDTVDYFGVEVSVDYSQKKPEEIAKELPCYAEKGEELIKAAVDAGLEVICLDEPYNQTTGKTSREEAIKENAKKFKDKKILIWYGAQHVSKYDRGLEKTPFTRRLMDEGIKPYTILLLTPRNHERLNKTILFYSPHRNDSFALKDLDKIPEKVYNYNMDVKEIFISYDAIIHHIPENLKVFEDIN